MHARRRAVNGIELCVLEEGEGETIVLCHGFPELAFSWRRQIPVLAAAGYRVLAPDMRGYGDSSAPAQVSAYDVLTLCEDLCGLLDSVGEPSAIFIGHDWGAIVSWVVAARYPERLRTLTAVSVPHPEAFADAYASPDSKQREMSGYIGVFRAEGDAGERMLRGDDGDGIRRMFEHVGLGPEAAAEHAAVHGEPGAMTAALNWYRATHPTLMRGIPPVAVPTLFVWSTLDPAISREAADGCASYVTGPFRYEVLDGVDHWVPELAADKLNRILLEHLAAHP